MASQFFGLNIAYTGLLASNAALNTTSNNIANVQTPGYSRQQVVQQASDAIRVFQTYGCAGAGVDTLAIERIRDEFYDGKYWDNNSNVGEYSIKQYYMAQIENYLTDDDKTKGFKTIFDDMLYALQEGMKNPNSTDTIAQFIGQAGNLVEYFKNLAGNMEALQKDVNQEIKLKVDEMNSLASEIAALNKQINVIELTGNAANELRDRRSYLVDQLSQIVDIEVKEVPVYDTNNPERVTGAHRYMINIAGGQSLVDGNEFRGLECVARKDYEKTNQTDIDGLYDVMWEDGQSFNLYNASMGGSLRGLVQMRDGNNGENFTGKIVDTGVNDAGNDTVTIQVTEEYLKDLNKCNLSDMGGKINLGNQIFYYDSWTYTCTKDAAGNATYEYTFTLSDNLKNSSRLTNDRVGKMASIGSAIEYQGIPYYMEQMNEWIRSFSQKVNDILAGGVDKYGNQGCNLFTGDVATSAAQYEFEDQFRYDKQQAGTTMEVSSTDASYYQLTAQNFAILDALIEDANLLATRKHVSDGVESNDILKEISDMAKNKDVMSFRGCTASEFLKCILSDVALNADRANMFYTNYSNIATSIDNQRISISGVDEDEEAVSLVKYQNAYNLASRMIQTLTEIYDRLILQTGV